VKTIRLLVTALVRVAPHPALIIPRTAILRPVRAKIKEKREVAEGTLLVVFDLLGAEVDFRAGQYFWVTLLDPPYDDEKGPRRHISVVTSPNERGVLGLCTRLRDSAFKRSLAELPVGTEVDVEQPKGNFLLPEDTDRPYVFIAGGIGITVFRCMLRYIAEEHLPYRVTLIYSNRDRASSAFLDELAELDQKENLRVVLTMTDDPDWDGETRRIGPDLLHDHLGSDLGSFEDTPIDSFRTQVETVFYGVVNVSKAVVPVLRGQGGGHLVQVSSLSARFAAPGLTAYQAAKWAVTGLSSGLALELAPFGVKVTVLEPGGMRTDWAGPSMTIPPPSPPYQPTIGAFAELVRAASGHEATSARRVAQVVRDLAGRDDAPLRLLLGTDAVPLAQQAARELAASDEAWREISLSVADGTPQTAEAPTHLGTTGNE